MVRSIKITAPEGAHYDGRTHLKDAIVAVPGDVADRFVSAGKAEIVADRPADGMAYGNPYREAVEPLVADADPLHAARMGSSKVEEHPGLVALADAGHPGAPKRQGRMVPDAVTTTTTAEPAPVVKPKDK